MVAKLEPKVCFTASGILIIKDKVLLVKHRKLNMWLCPGGHMEKGELPHQTAEREFYEEIGIKVKASPVRQLPPTLESVYAPVPVACNLHWISQENFQRRLLGQSPVSPWLKGCEQHFNFSFLVEPSNVKQIQIKTADEEVTDYDWFKFSDLKKLKTRANIRSELILAFAVYKNHQSGKM